MRDIVFTGIIQEKGQIDAVERIPGGRRVKIRAQESLPGMRLGDSIAVNGACLTVVDVDRASFAVEAMEPTLGRTTVGKWKVGDLVNLENPLSFKDLLGGHLVTGHVDGVGLIRAKVRRAGDVLLWIQPPPELMIQIYERGSVSVDGTSLTVMAVEGNQFGVSLIPHTVKATTLGSREVGDEVNLETDMIVKAVQRLLGPHTKGQGLTGERLRELGF